VQALIDHFFLDVEDRIRSVLQPGLVPEPYTSKSEFYSTPKALSGDGKAVRRAPERLVTQQMKIFREQWNGMGLALDLGLVRGDMEMAAAVWRNLLGARGARGIVLPGQNVAFRRSINPVGEIEKYSNMDERTLEIEEAKDDGSGVHDFGPDESDQYVRYPETMVTLITYIRRELVRLEGISDEDILGAMKIGTERRGVSDMRFGPVKG
jgi:cytochrome b pre-mRNA-processing protein 3